MPQLYKYMRFSHHTFSAHFVGFLFWYFEHFLLFPLYSFMQMKAYTACASAQAYIFIAFWPFSPKKIARLLKKSEQWPNKWSKVKTNQGVNVRFFTNSVWEIIIEKAVSICVIIPQNRKVKKFQLHIIDQSFEHNGMGISYQKKLESLEEKKAVHTSCRHGVRRICQLYTKGGPASKLTWYEPPRDHLDYRRRDNIQRSSNLTTGQAKTVTTLRLGECDFGHVLGARTFYTSLLRKCQKTYKKTFWLLTF